MTELARAEHLHLTPEEAEMYAAALDGVLGAIDRIDELDAGERQRRWLTRDAGRKPTAAEDPFNAFVRLCTVAGADVGPLAHMLVGVKDNLALAGVPITNGSRTASYTPTTDAVAVERLLDAGATIVGKLNLDDFSSSGTGESAFFAPARNPHNRARSAGGSSGGTGSAVASGHIDLGIARTVRTTAIASDVLFGHDERDAQWVRGLGDVDRCEDALHKGVVGMRVAVLEEGVLAELCEPDVLAAFERAVQSLADGGAVIERVSIPLWSEAWPIQLSLMMHLGWAMAQSEGMGWGHLGEIDEARAHGYALVRRLEADSFPPFVKVWLIAGRYLHEEYFSTMYAKAQNLRLALIRQVDEAFEHVDLIVMPTTPHVAPELLDEAIGEEALLQRGTTMVANTSPTNLSGHPSLAVPTGLDRDGLPTSIQIVAPRFADARTFQAGAVIEESVGLLAAPSSSETSSGIQVIA